MLSKLPVMVPDISDCHNTKLRRSTGARIFERNVVGATVKGAKVRKFSLNIQSYFGKFWRSLRLLLLWSSGILRKASQHYLML
jgi:hypothetical protein